MTDDRKQPKAPEPKSEAWQQVIQFLEDPDTPTEEKLALLDRIRDRAGLGSQSPTVERVYAALGKSAPAPLTPDELEEFDQEMARVNAAVTRRYGLPRREQDERPRKRHVA